VRPRTPAWLIRHKYRAVQLFNVVLGRLLARAGADLPANAAAILPETRLAARRDGSFWTWAYNAVDLAFAWPRIAPVRAKASPVETAVDPIV